MPLDSWTNVCTTADVYPYGTVWESIRKMKELVGEPVGRLTLVKSEAACDRVWEFPKDRFVEYEPKDEGWCRRLGFGREVIVPKAYIVKGQVDPIFGWRKPDQVICHPLLYNQILNAMRLAELPSLSAAYFNPLDIVRNSYAG